MRKCEKYKEIIFELYSNGLSSQKISELLPEKISWCAIINFLKSYGIEIKQSGFKKNHESGNRKKEITWKVDENGCWNCTSHAPNGDGYPGIKRNGKNMKVHRYMYEKYIGKISDGLHSLHKCDNRRCINPNHLFLGTNADNVADKMAKGRCKPGRGENHWNSKLTEKDIIKIRTQLLHLSNEEIANIYDVKKHAISNVRCGRSWKGVGE